MLLINNKQVNLDEFVTKVEEVSGGKVPLLEIKQNMEFVYNQVKSSYDLGIYRDTGRKIPKIGRGEDILAVFKVFSEKEGQTLEFRYASRTPYTNPNNPTVLVHDPKAIDFPAGTFSYEKREIEKVVYMYCHPSCGSSPLFKEGTVFKYKHNNLKEASQKKREAIDLKRQALFHAANVPEHDLKVLAKGMNIVFPEKSDAADIRVLLEEYALEKPKLYLDKVEKETTFFDGRVHDALELGIIKATNINGAMLYSFTKGDQAGQNILSVDPREKNPVEALKTYMKANIAKYHHYLATLNRDVSADMEAEKYLRSVKGEVKQEEFMPYVEELTLESVVDHKSAAEYLRESHPEKGNASPSNVKAFLEGVLTGEINDGNIRTEVFKYIRKS